MPRTHTLSGQDADLPKSKRQKLTNSQLERKRELDREAQRTIRERTKNHIAHLESLVQQLQGDQGGQVQRLVAQLNESRAEVNRLKDALNSIIKISASVTGAGVETTQATTNLSDNDSTIKQETSPLALAQSLQCRQSIKSYHVSQKQPKHRNAPDVGESEGYLTQAPQRHSPTQPAQAHCSRFPSHTGGIDEEDTRQCDSGIAEEIEIVHADGVPFVDDNLSVSQMAASIVGDSTLEGRYWYLAGVLLTQILKKQRQGGFVSYVNDEDIAIRAVFEGWSSVLERYPLDRGWQWLRELDETIYFHHFGPAERLMNLRNCRFQFLHQCYPEAGWNKHLPGFYVARSPQQNLLDGDPLAEHFPWPGFRKHLMLSPRKFATNKFMEALRCNLHFIWNHDPQALYQRDPYSGNYLFSDLFIKHIYDIKSYSARPDFFLNFPELAQDIPRNRIDHPNPHSGISHRLSFASINSAGSTNHASPVHDATVEDEMNEKDGDHFHTRYGGSSDWKMTMTTTSPRSVGSGSI